MPPLYSPLLTMASKMAFMQPRQMHSHSLFDWILGRQKMPMQKPAKPVMARPMPQIPVMAPRIQAYSTEKTIELPPDSFKIHGNIEPSPSLTVTITKEEALKYYYQMQTIRRMENLANAMYKDKTIRGFCHLYIGQEACSVGMMACLKDVDSVITAYRCHGWCYLMGIPLAGIMAELTGASTGCSRGKGGSMHMYGPRFYGGNGIVGAQVPVGTGLALMHKYKNDGGMSLTLYGDGAANQGQVFESYNMACLWKLPVVYVCENNQYAMGTSTVRASCSTDFYSRGHYIPGIWVDGMNVLAVRNATMVAVEHARKVGPIVLEMFTYRYMGHSMSDPGVSYRTREEVQEVRKKRDPIAKYKELCISNDMFTEDEIKEIDAKIKKEVDEAGALAKAAKEVETKELTADIYSMNFEPKIRDNIGYTAPHIQINKGANH